MRHGKKFNHLGRKKAHREAMLRNMACSLIEHKRIKTTVAKAKALRTFVEPLITKSKTDVMHSRRTVFSRLHNKYAVTELFREVAPKVRDRNGGYTRIIKLGTRLGDNAEMCYIELVDFNELMLADAKPAAKKSRRSRRGGGKKVADAQPATAAAVAEESVEDESTEAVAAEVVTAEVVEEASETEASSSEAVEEEVAEESTEEETAAEEVTEESTEAEAVAEEEAEESTESATEETEDSEDAKSEEE